MRLIVTCVPVMGAQAFQNIYGTHLKIKDRYLAEHKSGVEWREILTTRITEVLSFIFL